MTQMEPNVRGPYRSARSLVLASGSPRRKELLGSLGVEFEVLPVDAEPEPHDGETPADFAERAALAKAREAATLRPDAVILAADTIVVLDEEIMGKPESENDAMLMLTRLVNNTHHVITGCALMAPDQKEPSVFHAKTRVTMGPQPLEALLAYAHCGEPMDKAGAYAIQGVGGFLVSEISGSYTNVVGLPLVEVVEVLGSWGAVVPSQSF
jgi:septum formation protein